MAGTVDLSIVSDPISLSLALGGETGLSHGTTEHLGHETATITHTDDRTLPARAGGWAQIWSHSPPSAAVHRRPPELISTAHGRSRTLVNAGQHCWKACWGQPLRSSNLLSSATLTCGNAGCGGCQAGATQRRLSQFLTQSWLTFELQAVACRDLRSLLCLVTGVPRASARSSSSSPESSKGVRMGRGTAGLRRTASFEVNSLLGRGSLSPS